MITRSNSPLMTLHPFLRLACLTGITSSVFSRDLPPMNICKSKTFTISPWSLPFRTEDDDDESDFDFDDERNIANPLTPSNLLRRECDSIRRMQSSITPLWNGTLGSLTVKVCNLFHLGLSVSCFCVPGKLPCSLILHDSTPETTS